MASLLRCDQCGMTVEEVDALGWFVLTRQGVTCDFHSFECLIGWAQEQQ